MVELTTERAPPDKFGSADEGQKDRERGPKKATRVRLGKADPRRNVPKEDLKLHLIEW